MSDTPAHTEATTRTPKPVRSSGTFTLGAGSPGATTVHRLGFGAMQITGPGVWGEPANRLECIRVLRHAVDMGVDLIDTADSYGPEVSEGLIFEALHPYPDGLVIATKAGLTRQGPGQWLPVGRPEYLRQQCELSLRRLGLDRIDLFQLHRIDAKVPADEQFGLLADLVAEGKVAHVGLSQVSVAEVEAARRVVPIVSVQNLFNLTNRTSADVLAHCQGEGIGFIPWFPVASGALTGPDTAMGAIVAETGATPTQVALAWLLHHSPVLLPIPGTKSVAHVEENCEAATLQLTGAQMAALDAIHEAS
ncbi:MAG: aldo/keto reductase [Acidimicrobiales bacterium]|jgi:aryl-alcohol dehydrogenase-like predicted oxidoreductase